jgi:hypothetical protein
MSAPLPTRRELVRHLRAGIRSEQRRRRRGLLRAVEWLRRQTGLSLAQWHALTNPTRRRAVPYVALERLERVSERWARPIRAWEWAEARCS